MNKLLISAFFCLFSFSIYAQNAYKKDVILFQNELNSHYSDTINSPLLKKDLDSFSGLDFFSFNKKYCVEAKFQKVFNPVTVTLKTTTDRAPQYVKYAKVVFTMNKKEVILYAYRSEKLSEKEEYKDYLFLPFTDLTNGKTSYGGGRYVDLKMPEGDTVIIDFNKAYNPYCAYNHKYSCVVPPAENDIPLKIKAGVKKYNTDH